MVYADHIAQGGEEINLRDHAIDDFAARKTRSSHDEQDADAVIGEVAFHHGECDAVIGGADDDGVFGKSGTIYGVEDAPDFSIEDANAGFVSGGIVSGFGSVGQRRRGYAIARIVSRLWFGKAAMGNGISDVEKEGLVVRSVEKFNGSI